MIEGSGRALAWVDSDAMTLEALRARGWEVDDLGEGVLLAFRDFVSLADARVGSARDLPDGTAVDWSEPGMTRSGGFVVGYGGVAPLIGDIVPAFVLWPDGSQQRVESPEALLSVLRERAVWLVSLGFRS